MWATCFEVEELTNEVVAGRCQSGDEVEAVDFVELERTDSDKPFDTELKVFKVLESLALESGRSLDVRVAGGMKRR